MSWLYQCPHLLLFLQLYFYFVFMLVFIFNGFSLFNSNIVPTCLLFGTASLSNTASLFMFLFWWIVTVYFFCTLLLFLYICIVSCDIQHLFDDLIINCSWFKTLFTTNYFKFVVVGFTFHFIFCSCWLGNCYLLAHMWSMCSGYIVWVFC